MMLALSKWLWLAERGARIIGGAGERTGTEAIGGVFFSATRGKEEVGGVQRHLGS